MERLIEIYHPIHIVVLSSGNDVWENAWPQTLFEDENGYVTGIGYILDETKQYKIREHITPLQQVTFCGLGKRPRWVKLGDWLYQFQDCVHILRPIVHRLVNNFNLNYRQKLFSDVYGCGKNKYMEMSDEIELFIETF